MIRFSEIKFHREPKERSPRYDLRKYIVKDEELQNFDEEKNDDITEGLEVKLAVSYEVPMTALYELLEYTLSKSDFHAELDVLTELSKPYQEEIVTSVRVVKIKPEVLVLNPMDVQEITGEPFIPTKEFWDRFNNKLAKEPIMIEGYDAASTKDIDFPDVKWEANINELQSQMKDSIWNLTLLLDKEKYVSV